MRSISHFLSPTQVYKLNHKNYEVSAIFNNDSVFKTKIYLIINKFLIFFSSLPSLRPLLDVYYLPLTNMRIARTFCFTNNGQALYLVSPTEIQRLTYSQETCENLQVINKNITIISSEVKYSLRARVLSAPYSHGSTQVSLLGKIQTVELDFQSTCFETPMIKSVFFRHLL